MFKEVTLRDAITIVLIVFGAGVSYTMLSSRLGAVEAKTKSLETLALVEIPEIRERLVRLETKLDLLLETQSVSLK